MGASGVGLSPRHAPAGAHSKHKLISPRPMAIGGHWTGDDKVYSPMVPLLRDFGECLHTGKEEKISKRPDPSEAQMTGDKSREGSVWEV